MDHHSIGTSIPNISKGENRLKYYGLPVQDPDTVAKEPEQQIPG